MLNCMPNRWKLSILQMYTVECWWQEEGCYFWSTEMNTVVMYRHFVRNFFNVQKVLLNSFFSVRYKGLYFSLFDKAIVCLFSPRGWKFLLHKFWGLYRSSVLCKPLTELCWAYMKEKLQHYIFSSKYH